MLIQNLTEEQKRLVHYLRVNLRELRACAAFIDGGREPTRRQSRMETQIGATQEVVNKLFAPYIPETFGVRPTEAD